MKIKGVKEVYLRAPGQCKISQDEARLTHKWCESGDTLPYNPADIKKLKSDMKSIIAAYKKGQIVFVPDDLYPQNGKTTNVEKLVESTQAQETQVIYPDENEMPKPPNIGNKGVSQISDMDFEALKKEAPIGSIDPPMPGVKFKLRLKTPCASGFINDLGYGNYEMSQLQDVKTLTGDKRFKITHPNLSSSNVPVPTSGRITSVSENASKIAMPSETDPLIWRVLKKGKSLSYMLDQVAEGSPLLRADPKTFEVSEEEQRYWKAVLPLPDLVKQKLEAAQKEGNVDEIVHIITSFIGHRDKETKLSNFRYVCHPRAGKMFRFRGFAKEGLLPLLMNELKVGHCDLLSWYVASQLRAYGVTAWVSEDVLPTKDGKHFNGSYNHATVVIERPDGTLVNYDPTIHCDIDHAYHPKIMTGDLIDTLEDKLLEANTINEKAEVLRSFNREVLPPLRERANKDRGVMTDWRGIVEAGIFGSLIVEPSEFKNGFTEMRGVVADLSGLPKEETPQSILMVIKDIYEELPLPFTLGDEYSLRQERLPSKTVRGQVAWLYYALNKTKSFAFFSDFNRMTELMLDKSKKFTETDIRHQLQIDADSEEGCIRSVIGVMTERVSAKDLLTAYSAGKSGEYSGYIRGFGFTTSVACTNLLLLDTHHMTEFREHKYSKLFIEPIRKGHFPTDIDGPEVTCYDYPYFNVDEPRDYKSDSDSGLFLVRHDLINFAFEYQYACFDPNYKKHLIEKLGISEERFRDLSRYFLQHDKKLKRTNVNHFLKADKDEANNRITALENVLFASMLNNKCRENFARAVNQTLQRMDLGPMRGRVIEHNDVRQYVQGDDMKRLDWNAFARFEKYYVKQSPVPVLDVSTPVHVLLELDADFTSDGHHGLIDLLQIVELVRTLQQDSKARNREVYISVDNGDYYKLPVREKPENVLRLLLSAKGPRKLPFLQTGELPENLLYVSNTFLKISAMKHLYGSHCNFGYICLNDPPFRIYPLIKDEWVEKGFKGK